MKLATVTTWNDTAGSIACQLLGGPAITAWPLGFWPAPTEICWVEEAGDGTWVVDGLRANTGTSNSYQPTMAAIGGAPALGLSTLNGYYTRQGKWVDVDVVLNVGTGFNASTGIYGFNVPLVSAPREQTLEAKLFCVGGGTTWVGIAVIPASSTQLNPFFPVAQGDCRLLNATNADVTAAAGTGIPGIPGVYPLTAGSNLSINGRYEIT